MLILPVRAVIEATMAVVAGVVGTTSLLPPPMPPPPRFVLRSRGYDGAARIIDVEYRIPSRIVDAEDGTKGDEIDECDDDGNGRAMDGGGVRHVRNPMHDIVPEDIIVIATRRYNENAIVPFVVAVHDDDDDDAHRRLDDDDRSIVWFHGRDEIMFLPRHPPKKNLSKFPPPLRAGVLSRLSPQ
jgi:hypothetical protein